LSGNVAIVDDSVVVPFDELPTLPGSGLRHSWDVHGTGDQLGTLNRLTGPVVAASVGAVRTGERIGVSLPLGLPDPPFFGRQAFKHTVFPMAPFAFDDYLDGFYLQCSSQWDGLRHIGSPDGWYGGWQGAAEADPETLGIHHWAARGIIGRGLLIDLVSARDGTGYDPFSSVAFSPEELSAALAAVGGSLRYGDILCVRTGWMDKYLALSVAEQGELAESMVDVTGYTAAGLSGSESMARFLWDSGVAAVACDNPAVEVVPGDRSVGFLHGRLITGLGFAIGELFDFGPLAEACARSGRCEFLFVSVPLNLTGGVGSPANAVAILLGQGGQDARHSQWFQRRGAAVLRDPRHRGLRRDRRVLRRRFGLAGQRRGARPPGPARAQGDHR
jgi:kynurenine formamidase